MGTTLSTAQHADHLGFFSSVCLASLLIIAATLWMSYSTRMKRLLKRFIRVQVRRRLLNRRIRASETDSFASYYRQTLCHLQKTNNDLLGEILLKNHSCQFFIDRSISFLSTHRPSPSEDAYLSVDEFRAQVPLTTYEDFRPYIDRIVLAGEKNVISSEKIIYFATSSGTTGKYKVIPVTWSTAKTMRNSTLLAYSVIYRSLPAASFPAPEQRSFNLNSGKKATIFPRSKDGTAIGALSLFISAVSPFPGARTIMSTMSVQPLGLLEEMPDFKTSAFVQLTCALATPDLFSYSVTFAPALIHSVKMIKTFYEEMAHCIELGDFEHSSLVRQTVSDAKVRKMMNRALKEAVLEYGGASYQLSRAKLIREQCQDSNAPALLHRLWPQLLFVSTAIGGSFAIYREEIEFYCGNNLPLINMIVYGASEGFFGSLASISTDEYFLFPTSAFFEFIREEDIHQVGQWIVTTIVDLTLSGSAGDCSSLRNRTWTSIWTRLYHDGGFSSVSNGRCDHVYQTTFASEGYCSIACRSCGRTSCASHFDRLSHWKPVRCLRGENHRTARVECASTMHSPMEWPRLFRWPQGFYFLSQIECLRSPLRTVCWIESRTRKCDRWRTTSNVADQSGWWCGKTAMHQQSDLRNDSTGSETESSRLHTRSTRNFLNFLTNSADYWSSQSGAGQTAPFAEKWTAHSVLPRSSILPVIVSWINAQRHDEKSKNTGQIVVHVGGRRVNE